MELWQKIKSYYNEVSSHVLLFFITAVTGAFISYGINLLLDWSRNTASVDINGKWMSVSCDRSNEKGAFIAFDVVDVDVSFLGGVTMTNAKNKKLNDYAYTGTGKVLKGRYFFGEWQSIKEGANTNGAFSFVISPQGDSLIGTFTGYDDFGSYTQCWIMGRSAGALQRGYELSQSQIKVPDTKPLDIPQELVASFQASS